LKFRSDKAFMTATEVERRAQAQRELQDELARQVAEKKALKVREGCACVRCCCKRGSGGH
jgi:hypothetical protein